MTTETHPFTINPQGPFSLQEAATFGFGQTIITVRWIVTLLWALCAMAPNTVILGPEELRGRSPASSNSCRRP